MGVKVKYSIETKQVAARLEMLARPEVQRLVLEGIGAHMLRSIDARFTAEQDPDGRPWEPVSAARRREKKNPRILTESTRLRDSIVYQFRAQAVEVGTNVKYGAIHQLGGTIDKAERSHDLYFRITKKKGLLNRFVKRKRANFVQTVTIGAHQVTMPARPYLGVSAEDEAAFEALIGDVLLSVLEK